MLKTDPQTATPAGELLPCPFCGGSRARLTTNARADMSWVTCPACGLEAPSETGVSTDQAVKYWNTRAHAKEQAAGDHSGDATNMVAPAPASPVGESAPGHGELASLVSDEAVEIAAQAYAEATGYYAPFHRGLSSPSADKIRLGIKAALQKLSASQGGEG